MGDSCLQRASNGRAVSERFAECERRRRSRRVRWLVTARPPPPHIRRAHAPASAAGAQLCAHPPPVQCPTELLCASLPPRGPGVRKDGLPRAEAGGGLVAGHGRVSGGLPVSPGRDALVSVRETAPCGGKLHARAVGDGGEGGIRHRLYSQWVGLVRPPLTTAFRPHLQNSVGKPLFSFYHFPPTPLIPRRSVAVSRV